MGIIRLQSELVKIAKDYYLRCDPLHVINFKKYQDVYNELNIAWLTLTDAVDTISNGINIPASLYSLEPTSDIYLSVKEFGNGTQFIIREGGEYYEGVTFIKDDIRLFENYESGLIRENEVIVARSGAIGKVAWFGEFLHENPDINLISSGFTTKLKINDRFDSRFITLWLNQAFIRDFLIAKSAGKCQRNISQDYLYVIPIPNLTIHDQRLIAERYYLPFIRLEQEIVNIRPFSSIADNILERIFGIRLDFGFENGVNRSSSSLINISKRYSLRCDTKQENGYFKRIEEIFDNINFERLGYYFNGAFIKGKQPRYLDDQEGEGIPIISTYSIQDNAIIKENCKKISEEDFNNTELQLKPIAGDILLTLDGAVSVGKPAYYDFEEDYGIDSHIGIIRLDNIDEAPLIACLLGSKLCNAQFRLFETGNGSMSINEIDLRQIKVPKLNEEQKVIFNELFERENLERSRILNTVKERRSDLNLDFIQAIMDCQ